MKLHVADRYPTFFWSKVEPFLGEVVHALGLTAEGAVARRPLQPYLVRRAPAASPAPASGTVPARRCAAVLDHADMAVEAGEPLPAFGREAERMDRLAEERFDLRPEERWIAVRHIRGRFIAQHLLTPISANSWNNAFSFRGYSGSPSCPIRSAARTRPLPYRSPCNRRRWVPGSA